MLVVRDRHRIWIKDTEAIEINRLRRDIIDLIEKTVDQYDLLLAALQRQRAGDAVEASINPQHMPRASNDADALHGDATLPIG